MKIKRGVIQLLFILLASIFLVSASINTGNESNEIATVYGPGTSIQGWVNLSVSSEPVNTLIKDSPTNNQISILNLLRSDSLLREQTDYSCVPSGCGLSYSANNSQTSKNFNLQAGDSKIVGFKLTGIISSINEVIFNITSNAGESCVNQLNLDFFADDELDTGNNKNSSQVCADLKTYGCFDIDKPSTELSETNMVGGTDVMYCQRMELSESPGFRLGALMKVESSARITKMAIYDLDLYERFAECSLGNAVTAGWEEKYCDVSYLVTESKDYYVCIYNTYEQDDKTFIKYYDDTATGCGFLTPDGYPQTEEYAYQIFAQGKKFAPIGTLQITERDPFDEGLSSRFEVDIIKQYGSLNCQAGCIIPIKFNSNVNQEITINNIQIKYATSGALPTERNVYDLNLTSALVSTAGFKKISLNAANLTLSSSLGSFPYYLKTGAKTLFSETISIQKVPIIKSLSPTIAFTKFPIEFKVNVELVDNATIASYSWQFGNATPETTTQNKITHTFNTEGQTTIKVSATDTNGKIGTKIYNIEVKSYLKKFDEELTKAKVNLANISAKVLTFPQFYQDSLKLVLDVDALKQKIAAIEIAYGQASTDEQYQKVVTDFLALSIPESISEKINTNSLTFYPNKDLVDMGVIKQALGGNYSPSAEAEYRSAVVDWSIANIDSKVKYKQLAAEYSDRSEPLLNIFEFKIRQSGFPNVNSYLFIKQIENLKFDKSYSETVVAGYVKIALAISEKTITFATTQDIGIINLPAFMSPAISELSIVGQIEEAEVKGMNWPIFLLVLFLLIAGGFIVYIVLQYWYKTKYETFLFKDRNYLFNLINYIDSQKNKGLTEDEIFSKLKKSGWNSEQVNYVLKKYAGKRTGMFEIPIEKILNLFRKKQEPAGLIKTPTPGNVF